jgi:uracil-DNA glycosylase
MAGLGPRPSRAHAAETPAIQICELGHTCRPNAELRCRPASGVCSQSFQALKKMPTTFDPGAVDEPFSSLCDQPPDQMAYPYSSFRVEWGPIFHRGRLDGTARILCIGQDPAQNEAVIRRILIGVAGHRVQGFLAKLGLDRSYVMINAFLYSVYDQNAARKHISDPAIAEYRNRWLAALTASEALEAVVAFGSFADIAWREFKKTAGSAANLPYRHVPHPTSPDSAGGTPEQVKTATAAMLAKWNSALQFLRQAVRHPDAERPLVPYGADFRPDELVEIPPFDVPAGVPAWMRDTDGWAVRSGATAIERRRTISVQVPAGIILQPNMR